MSIHGRETTVQLSIDGVRGRTYGPPKRDVSATTFTGVGSGELISFFINSYFNLKTAVQARVFGRCISGKWELISSTPHQPGLYDLFAEAYGFYDVFRSNIVTIAPMTDDEFIQHYSGRRRIRYENARNELQHRDLEFQDAFCKCFLKKEKDIPARKKDAVPRVITFPDPTFGFEFGKFVKPFEHVLFDVIDQLFGSKTVMKGLNYLEVGSEIHRKWSRFREPMSIDGDVSRLDSSISNEGQQLYHKILQMYFTGVELEHLKFLCSIQLDVQVSGTASNGKIAFESSGLGSGQMNTSQMGVFIVCFILNSLFKEYKLDLELVNCGDDFTIIGEPKDVLAFQKHSIQWFLKFNMILKLEKPQTVIERIVFCQTQPILIGGFYRMVRDFRTALVKDSTSIDNLTTIGARSKYLRAISCTGIATHGGVPIFQDAYAMFGKSAFQLSELILSKSARRRNRVNSIIESSMGHWGKNLSLQYTQISDETRYSFYLAFDVDPVEQVHYEQYYNDLLIRNDIAGIITGDIFSR